MSPPERTLRDEMTEQHIPYALMAHSEQGELDAAVAVRRCAAGTRMEKPISCVQIASVFRARAMFYFLPERLAISPVVPAYRYGDQAFGLIVDWTISALIEAEALGIQEIRGRRVEREDMRTDQ